jgi:hypothetical protein
MNGEPGDRPELAWIDIKALKVDMSYQRSTEGGASQKLINQIAADFRWGRFIPLTVCRKDGKKFHIIDGQHRYLGAKKRGGIAELPCYIIEAESVEDEAAHFTALNQNRVRMHTVDMFHARLASGERKARNVQKICSAAGVKICKAPFTTSQMPQGQTQAVGTLERASEKSPHDACVRALKCLAQLQDPGQLRSRVIEALIQLYTLNFNAGREIDDKALVAVLAENDAYDLEMGARLQHEVYGGNIPAGIMDALASAYNDGLKPAQKIIGEQGGGK